MILASILIAHGIICFLGAFFPFYPPIFLFYWFFPGPFAIKLVMVLAAAAAQLVFGVYLALKRKGRQVRWYWLTAAGVVLVLIGAGFWLYFSPAHKVPTPKGSQVITMDVEHIMGGRAEKLFIYEDGAIIYIEEKGLRMPTWENPPTRTWKTGKLSEGELNSLLEFIKNSGFDKLNEYYQFPGKEIEDDGFVMGDMDYTVSINYGDLHKTARAFGYLTPDYGMTYPDMPYPLNEIYQKLKNIAETKTEEVCRENIS